MIYPTISIEQARDALWAARKQEVFKPQAQWIGDEGKRFDVERLDDLADELQLLRLELGEPASSPRGYFGRFEGRAARVVHSLLDLPPLTAVDHEFWAWLTLGGQQDYLAKLVTWRHGKQGEDFSAQDVNYGLSTSLEMGFYSRLWLRADLAYDDLREDPYELVERGDQDLWRSHIMRTDYGQVPNVARALLLFQYSDESPTLSRVDTSTIRAMAKELRRRQATSAYELLNADEARELVEDVFVAVSRTMEE